MTTRPWRSRRQLSCIAVLVLLGACGATPPSHFYTLSSVPPEAASERSASEGDTTSAIATLLVGTIDIPRTLDRPQFVKRAGANKVDVAETDRWSEPLDEMIRHVLAADLTARLAKTRVITSTLPSVPIDRTLVLEIDRFEADTSGVVRLIAQWFVLSKGAATSRVARRSTIEQRAASGDTETLVATMSTVLSSLSDEMANALLALSPAPSR